MPPPSWKRSSGFTLLEMLTVLAILALVSSVALPALRKPPEGLRLDAAARMVAASLRLCRTRSIAQNRNCVFSFDVAAKAFQVDDDRTILDPGIAVEMIAAQAVERREQTGTIAFFPDGTSSGGDIVLGLGPRRARVITNWLTGISHIDLTDRGGAS